MQHEKYDSSASGYVTDSFEGISQTFTDVEVLSTSEINIVAKAKRYGRWWLLKGLRKEVADEAGYQQRLRKELEILTALQHPNIVMAVGLEEVESLGLCIVMEYVDGVTLKEWLQGETTWQLRRRVLRDLLEAVEYMHKKGIIHRDLKPENIVITRQGDNVKLIDFGLADTESHTVLKQPAGTERYMSPEQKKTAVADARNDIYSLGIVMQQMSLGSGYRNIINRCIAPIDQRWGSVGEIILRIDRQQDIKKYAWISGLVIAIALVVVMVVWMIVPQEKPVVTDKSAPVDQPVQEQSAIQDMEVMSQSKKMDGIAPHPQQQVRERLLNEAIDKGCSYVDAEVAKTKIDEHLDTLQSLLYLRKDFGNVFAQSDTWCERYLQTLGSELTTTEKQEVRDAVNSHISKVRDRWMKKYNERKEAYETLFNTGN